MISQSPAVKDATDNGHRGLFPVESITNGPSADRFDDRPFPWDIAFLRWADKQVREPRRVARLALWSFRKFVVYYRGVREYAVAEFGPKTEPRFIVQRRETCHVCEQRMEGSGTLLPLQIAIPLIAAMLAVVTVLEASTEATNAHWWVAAVLALVLGIASQARIAFEIDHRGDGWCGACACPNWLRSKLSAKRGMAKSYCPLMRWPGRYPRYPNESGACVGCASGRVGDSDRGDS